MDRLGVIPTQSLLFSALLCSALLYSTPLYSTLLHSTPLYSTPLHSTPLHSSRVVSSRLVSSRLLSSRLVSSLLFLLPASCFVLSYSCYLLPLNNNVPHCLVLSRSLKRLSWPSSSRRRRVTSVLDVQRVTEMMRVASGARGASLPR